MPAAKALGMFHKVVIMGSGVVIFISMIKVFLKEMKFKDSPQLFLFRGPYHELKGSLDWVRAYRIRYSSVWTCSRVHVCACVYDACGKQCKILMCVMDTNLS